MTDDTFSVAVNYTGHIQYLEHVVTEILVSIPKNNHGIKRGDLQIELTSPSGTLSILLHPRMFDRHPGDYVDWPFTSVMFWGEDPTGEWTLIIKTREIPNVANVGKVEFHF